MERKTQNDDIKPPVFPHTQWLRGGKKKREEKKKLPMGAGKKRWETPGLPYFVKRKYKRCFKNTDGVRLVAIPDHGLHSFKAHCSQQLATCSALPGRKGLRGSSF